MADAIQVQRRRGTESQCLAMIPAEAETIIDLTNDRIRIGDGVTAGGIIVPNGYDIQQQALTFAVAGGTADAITVSLAMAPLAYAQPLTFKVRIVSTNTGPATIDVNGLGVKDIYKSANGAFVALESGDLVAGGIYELIYNGVQFQISSGSGISSVSQGDLNTSTGVVSISGANTNFATTGTFVAPGGEYGFWPSSRRTAGSVTGTVQMVNVSWSTFSARISLQFPATPTSTTISAQQRYITSSPPYDMGDGDVGGFMFALVNKAGEIVGTYIADAPPWAYNGPTDIRCTHKCKATGKKFRKALKKRSFEQLMDNAPIEFEMQEITHKIKNADMGLIPHPFADVPEDHTVVLLDPMSDKVSRMIQLQNNGGSEMVTDMISKGYIKLDNSPIKRCCPKGVHVSKFQFKSTK